jgi:hypothetical protein
MNRPDLSVITVCMNRQQHLLETARRIAAWPHHQEHLILDWSSRVPVERAQLPPDSRIRLERVDGEQRWNLCRAYNLAARLARGRLLMKLDADCWPDQFDPELLNRMDAGVCRFGSGPDGRLGQFLMHRSAFEAVGGFNEVLLGYGFDDKDLKARLASLGFQLHALPVDAIGVIAHSIHERVSRDHVAPDRRLSAYEESFSFAQRRATAMSNRVAAAHWPWTVQRPATRYHQNPDGHWQAKPASLPALDSAAAAELERLRRQVFWSRFLELPELHVKVLPVKLLPPDRAGHFPVRWWHRFYWHSVRHLLRLPVDGLAACKGSLKRLR